MNSGTRSFGLAIPASWSLLDLDPETAETGRRLLVAEAIPDGPGASEARALMARLLEPVAETAVYGEAQLAALYSSVAEGLPLGASLVASVLEATPGPDGRPPPGGWTLVESLQATVGGGGGERQDLPAGPSVRVQRRQVSNDAGVRVEVETVQWFVLHPTGERMAVLSFSTPNVGLAEAFGEVFDAIAWSLQWTD